jgi:hypothetical protein
MIIIDNLTMYYYESRYIDIGVIGYNKPLDNIIGILKNVDDDHELRLWGLTKSTFTHYDIDSVEFDDDPHWHHIVVDGFDDI